MNLKSTCEESKQGRQSFEKKLAGNKVDGSGLNQLSRYYLEEILNNTSMPVYLKDATYKYIFMNRQLGQLAHVDHTQVSGKDDFAVFSEPVAQLFRSQDEEVVRRRSLVDFEETILLPDGVQTFLTSKFPLFDNKGKIVAVGGVCTNITARKTMEAELKEAEAKYRGIFENSPLGILHVDEEGVVTAANKKIAEILGSSEEGIVNINLLEYLQNDTVGEAVTLALSGQMAHREGSYLPVTGGDRVYLNGDFSPIFASDGVIIGAIGVIEDVTRRKKAEDALQKAHDELEQRVDERTAQLALKTKRLIETNIALEILLKKREVDKKELEEKVLFNIEQLIYPYLEKLKMRCEENSQKTLLQTMQSNLGEITSSFAHKYKDYLSSLTPTQIQIAGLIKQGLTTKEIASLLHLSPSTVSCHRQEIRKRLSLTNKKINLQAALTVNSQ